MPNFMALNHKATGASVAALTTLLADTYVLSVKTQNYHWNVEGPTFAMLHPFFGEQYEALAEAIDEIAERIRMLGHKTPAGLQTFLTHTRLKEMPDAHNSHDMIQHLLHDHESIVAFLRKVLKEIEELGDEGTIDFFITRIEAHEKTAWMLRSHLR